MANPQFRDAEFLRQHIQSIMAFYHPRCIDQNGGFFHYFLDDGTVYDATSRHLVSSARFVFNYAMAARYFNDNQYVQVARHGMDFLHQVHRNVNTGGYAWVLEGKRVLNGTNHCYGHAFVLLAYAKGLQAGIEQAGDYLQQTWELMEQHFWSESDGLYRDEINQDWSIVSPYRGQNANMHSCEALLAAYTASRDSKYLQRAMQVAENMVQRQAALADGLIWEHYDRNWQIDWDYNKEDPRHLFRPWGFQPGHQIEWAKLLLLLEQQQAEPWLLPRARELFDRAISIAWDNEFGGIYYGFAPDNSICDSDKYFWVQAEALAAAALLAVRTGESSYWDWYERLWAYCWQNFIDHEYGAWYRILNRQNNKYDLLKSPAGKTDYHTMGACYDVVRLIENN